MASPIVALLLAGCPWIAPRDYTVLQGPPQDGATESGAGSADDGAGGGGNGNGNGGGGGGSTVASDPVDQDFDVGPFTAISNRTAFDIDVSSGARAVTLSCPPTLLAALSVNVVQGELRIDEVDGAPQDGWDACSGVVTAPMLFSAETLGFGDLDLAGPWLGLAFLTTGGFGGITVDRVEGPDLHVDTAGSGGVTVGGGSVGFLTVLVGGSGDTDTVDLTATDAIVESDGSGTAELWVERSAAIAIYGSGDVILWGSPVVDVIYEGSGDVILK